MSMLSKTLLTGIATLALSAGAASAAVVCNYEGDCWRTQGRADYRPHLRLSVHPDNWQWRRGERYRWRESGRGHGYYHSGRWMEIR